MRVLGLEGINGAGKSTVAATLRGRLNSAGRSCLVTDPAAFGALGRAFRKKLVEATVEHHADFDAVVFAALRAEGARSLLESRRHDSVDVIVLERWTLALEAYGLAADASPGLISELVQVLTSILEVDATVLIDVTGRLVAERIPPVARQNRFERMGVDYADRLAEQHRAAAVRRGAFVVDGAAPANDVAESVFTFLLESWTELSLK